jgi:carboxylate-amine ligase
MYHPSFNIGIEEEYQLIDPESWALIGYVTQSMAHDQIVVQERHPNLDFAKQMESAVHEVGMPVCADIKEARERLLRTRNKMLELADAHDFKLAAAGTHPFSRWEKTALLSSHYRIMAGDAEVIARRMLAFGMHVHIGIEDRELAIDVMNSMRYVLPHILTLSTSSPFWAGRNTGLKSYRTVLLGALPRTGIPGQFSGYPEYHNFVDTLVRTNSIPDVSYIWYDILPHYRFPTLCVRICDMVPDYKDALAIAALIQAVVAWMVDLRQHNMSFRIYERLLIEENKWRAVRYGLDGNMIDLGIEEKVPTRDLIRELLDRVAPLASKLNIVDELAHIHTILDRGANADQQLRIWRENNEDCTAVVKFLVQETENIA